jgi:hypothetical protein
MSNRSRHQGRAIGHECFVVAGADVHMPEDTEWGQHEGALIDRDGNVLVFGSSIR